MEVIQLQTNPVCTKCKKGHTMKLVGFDELTQIAYYSTDCRKLPLKIPATEVEMISEDEESFFFNSLGWITYISTHGNYTFQLSKNLEENAYALAAAYAGAYGIQHKPTITAEEDELD